MEQNENYIKFINSIFQNLSTALQSIEDMLPKVADEDFKKELSEEYSKYDLLSRECEMLAKSEGINLKDNNWFEKLKLWGSINMGTMIDKSTRNIAQMFLLGTVMGIVQCLKDLKDYSSVSDELTDLCTKLSDLEENNYQNLKNFL